MKKRNFTHLTKLTVKLKKKNSSNIFLEEYLSKKEKIQNLSNNESQKFFDNSLIFLSEKLNKIHSCNYNNNFWKLILGYYIHIMISIIINKINYYENISQKDYLILNKVSNHDYIAENIHDFMLLINNDYFNNAIYFFLFKLKNNYNFQLVSNTNPHLSYKLLKKKKINFYRKFIINLKNLLRNFSSDKEILFYNTNLKFIKNVFLYKKFTFFYNSENYYATNLNVNLRKFNCFNIKNKQEILNYFLIKFIPKSYLENFKYLYNNKLNKIFSKNIKVVITESAHIIDDEFKFWLAKNNYKKNNIKLVQFQSGAGYNCLKNNGVMEFRNNISDYMFSWGKKNNYKKKQIYIGYPHHEKIKYNLNKKILYICNELPLYSIFNSSIPEGQKFREHISFHENFFKNLSKDISERIFLKPYFYNYGWNVIDNIKKINISINIEKETNIKKLYSKYFFFICSTPTTSFYEVLYYNLPSIIIFSNDLWQFDSKTYKIFNNLKQNNVYFDDYYNAAKFLNSGVSKILDNWNSANTQEAINIFKENFICKNPNFNNLLNTEIKKIKNKLFSNN